ncbi:hypothetical protein AAG587_17085 [Vreelandella neptunia]
MLETMAANASDHKDWEAVYAKRAAVVQAVASTGSIKVNDLPELDRLGRFTVAMEHWSICDQGARDALLNDQHPHVRSCALNRSQKAQN